MSRFGVWYALLAAGMLTLSPFIPAWGGLPLTAGGGVITALAVRGAHRAAARLGLFVTLYSALVLVGSAYSQVSFGAAIILYLLAVRRLPPLQGDQAWRHRGRFGRDVQAWCLIVAAGAAVGLLLWRATARPDLTDLVNRFVPEVGPGALVLGGAAFAMINAAVEEIAYRGIVLDALHDAGLPVAGAIGLQAIAFGTMHIAGFPRGWSGVGLATVYATVLGAMRMRAGGMLAPWVTHVLTDIVVVTVVLAMA